MIISASYRTDIPAFYTPWFMNRLQAGFCMVKNPYGSKDYRVSLEARDVDGFIFWSRNMRPLMPHLDQIRTIAPFVTQMTITNLPRSMEKSVVPASRAIEDLREIAARFGQRATVWRYDPVVFSDLTGHDWHLVNFRKLASELEGMTDEVVLSSLHSYAKTRRNMDAAARDGGFQWKDPEAEAKKDLLSKLAEIALEYGMVTSLCAQPDLLTGDLTAARCVDAVRLADLAGVPFKSRQKGNREGCLCAESRDIGSYDSCPHGCAYCYATRNRTAAQKRHLAHDPISEKL